MLDAHLKELSPWIDRFAGPLQILYDFAMALTRVRDTLLVRVAAMVSVNPVNIRSNPRNNDP